jgi:small multidrug resistance family-3 protein
MKSFVGQLIATPFGVLLTLSLAALLEVMGDACFQSGLHRSSGMSRGVWFVMGAAVLAGYGLFVNLPDWNFGKLLGVYVVLFFLMAQVVARVRFHESPSAPMVVGGALIVAGGLVMTLWRV